MKHPFFSAPVGSFVRLLLKQTAYLLAIHTIALIVFGLLRLALFLAVPYTFTDDITTGTILTAFLKGLWFDNVISCYVMALPLIVIWFASLAGWSSRRLLSGVMWWFAVLYSICFIVAGANIPYFCYFFQTINNSIFQWFEFIGTTLGMLFQEKSYWFFILLLAIIIAGWILLLKKLTKLFAKWIFGDSQSAGPIYNIKGIGTNLLVGAVLVAACFFGIRGRVGYNPIKVSQAYFCNDPFLNQLGVNPVFNLLTSYLDSQRSENKRLTLMDDSEAISSAQQLLGRTGIEGISPIAQQIAPSDTAIFSGQKPNVVIILMESMSASLMTSLDRPKSKPQLTPFLDSLYQASWSMSNMYSAGNHTNHGMYATLYSWPAIMFRNLMKGTVIPQYSGLPTVLHDNGYRTFFFMTHESQYDNMNAFFRTNGFDEIYAQENYPAEKVVNSFGVQDDFLYSYAVPKLTGVKDQPFFAVLLSISNHPPYVIPSYFHPRSKDVEDQIVEYADWSLRQFFAQAKKQPWYDNTIFVLLGDHGKMMDTPESELPQSYNHIPLIINGPGIKPHIDSQWALQEDVAPTLLGMLGLVYTQNNFGLDLNRQHRDCVFYTGDKIVAARDADLLYLYSPSDRQEVCYKVEGPNKVSAAKFDQNPRFKVLKQQVFTMLQTAEVLMEQKKTLDHRPK